MSALRRALHTIADGKDLSREEAREAMRVLMSGDASPTQFGALLMGMRLKGPTDAEVAGFAEVMRENSVPVPTRRDGLVDTCGTGGDACETFNISTVTAFVVAGAGVPVAKHGSRAVSSACGSSDVLAALGVNTDASPEAVGRCIDEAGIGFLFAVRLHPAMKHAAAPRAELGMRTVFNLLGPLTNPAGARRQVVGVYGPEAVPLAAGALARLGCDRALVVHGLCGLDEVSTVGPTCLAWVENGEYECRTVTPSDFGLPEARTEDLRGGPPAASARIVRDILAGDEGPKADIVLANAACAIVAAGVTDDLEEAMERARASVASGAAAEKLEELRALSQEEVAACS